MLISCWVQRFQWTPAGELNSNSYTTAPDCREETETPYGVQKTWWFTHFKTTYLNNLFTLQYNKRPELITTMPCWDCWGRMLSCRNILFICWEHLSSSKSWHSVLCNTKLLPVAAVPLIITIAIKQSAGFDFAVSHFSLTGLQSRCGDY